jgi:hypothetical protein
MKRFQFRLQQVMNLREQEEELWKLKLAQAARIVSEIDLSIEQTITEEQIALTRYRDPTAMFAAQFYMLKMKADRERYRRDRETAEEKRLAILQDYIVVRQKAEVLRKLHGRHQDAWGKKNMEDQDAQNDDFVASRRILQSHGVTRLY